MVRAGYKQTEVGEIPEDWGVESFGDLVNYTKGFAFKSSEYAGHGIRVIRVSDTTYSSINDEGAVYVSKNVENIYKKWRIKENDLIFSTVGSKPPMYDSLVGKAILVTKEHNGSLLNQNAVIIRSKKFSREFQILLLNNFRTARYIRYIEIIFRGNANQASITLEDLFNYKIPLPAYLEEQKAIAKALSDVDELIVSLEKLIAKKREIKTATMQQLLTGKKRLAGFGEGKGYQQTEIGEIPEDWKLSTFANACSYINDGTHHTPKYVDNGVPFFSVENVTANEFSNTKFITKTEHEKLIVRCKPERGDILLTRIGTLGKTKLIDWDVDASIYVSLALLKLKDFIDPSFVYAYTKSNQFVYDLEKLSLTNATPQKINMAEIGLIPIPFPEDTDEQIGIAKIIIELEDEIGCMNKQLEKTKVIKQGMMQELLTGKTRLL